MSRHSFYCTPTNSDDLEFITTLQISSIFPEPNTIRFCVAANALPYIGGISGVGQPNSPGDNYNAARFLSNRHLPIHNLGREQQGVHNKEVWGDCVQQQPMGRSLLKRLKWQESNLRLKYFFSYIFYF